MDNVKFQFDHLIHTYQKFNQSSTLAIYISGAINLLILIFASLKISKKIFDFPVYINSSKLFIPTEYDNPWYEEYYKVNLGKYSPQDLFLRVQLLPERLNKNVKDDILDYHIAIMNSEYRELTPKIYGSFRLNFNHDEKIGRSSTSIISLANLRTETNIMLILYLKCNTSELSGIHINLGTPKDCERIFQCWFTLNDHFLLVFLISSGIGLVQTLMTMREEQTIYSNIIILAIIGSSWFYNSPQNFSIFYSALISFCRSIAPAIAMSNAKKSIAIFIFMFAINAYSVYKMQILAHTTRGDWMNPLPFGFKEAIDLDFSAQLLTTVINIIMLIYSACSHKQAKRAETILILIMTQSIIISNMSFTLKRRSNCEMKEKTKYRFPRDLFLDRFITLFGAMMVSLMLSSQLEVFIDDGHRNEEHVYLLKEFEMNKECEAISDSDEYLFAEL